MKPDGAFIQALASTTNSAENAPLTVTARPERRCTRADTRSQP